MQAIYLRNRCMNLELGIMLSQQGEWKVYMIAFLLEGFFLIKLKRWWERVCECFMEKEKNLGIYYTNMNLK